MAGRQTPGPDVLEKPRNEREVRRQHRRETRAQQTYKHFLKKLMKEGKMGEDFAERAAVSVLCTLERRLMQDEALDMEAQLPQKLQSLLYACSKSTLGTPEKFTRDEFVRRVGEDLGMAESEAEPVLRSVLITVMDSISEGEAQDVIDQLPTEFHDLFRRGA